MNNTRFSRSLKIKRLSFLMMTMCMSAAYAQADAAVQPESDNEIKTLDAVVVEVLSDPAITEGTDSYSAAFSRAGTGLLLSPKETPQTISVMTHQLLKDENLTSTKDVMEHSVGISTEPLDANRVRYSSRGFSIANYMFDGVPTEISARGVNMGGESDIDTFMFDRVEIVRGANGLMQGVGDPSASVNYIRKRAASKEFEGQVSVGVGDHSHYRATADISTPLNQSGSARGRVVGVYDDQRDSYLDRVAAQHNVVLATAEAEVTDSTNVRVGIAHQHTKDHGVSWFGSPVFYTDGGDTDFHRGANPGADWATQDTSWLSTWANIEQMLSDTWRLDASYTFSRNWHDTKKLGQRTYINRATGFFEDPAGATGRGAARGIPSTIYNRGDHYQRAVDVRIHGPFELFGQEHELMFGGTYNYRSELYYVRNPLNRLTPGGSFYDWNGSYPEPEWGQEQFDSDTRTRERALFAATRINPTDWLHFVGGVRWNRWSIDVDSANPLTQTVTHVTPYAGVLVDFLPDHTAYFSYTDVFRPQQLQTADGGYLDPLKGRNYEVGIKSSWLNDQLNTNLSVFQIELANMGQPEQGVFVENTAGLLAYRKTDKTKSRGFDFEFNGHINPYWKVFGGFTYWVGHDDQRNAINTIQPRATAKLFTTYDMSQLVPGLTAGAGIRYQSRVYDDFASPVLKGETQRFQQGGMALVDLMASYEINDHVTARVNFNNLFDRKYWQVGRSNSGMPGEGRNFMVNLDFKF